MSSLHLYSIHFFFQPMCLQSSCVSQTPEMKDSLIRSLLYEHTRISKQGVSYSIPNLLGKRRANGAIRSIALVQYHLSLHRHPCITHSQSPWWVRPDVEDAVRSRLTWPSPPSSWALTESRTNNQVQHAECLQWKPQRGLKRLCFQRMTLKEIPKDKDTVIWSKTVKRKESQCVNPTRLWPTLLGEGRPREAQANGSGQSCSGTQACPTECGESGEECYWSHYLNIPAGLDKQMKGRK